MGNRGNPKPVYTGQDTRGEECSDDFMNSLSITLAKWAGPAWKNRAGGLRGGDRDGKVRVTQRSQELLCCPLCSWEII